MRGVRQIRGMVLKSRIWSIFDRLACLGRLPGRCTGPSCFVPASMVAGSTCRGRRSSWRRDGRGSPTWSVVDLVALAEIGDQGLGRGDLPGGRRLLVEVADQADADAVFVDVVGAGVAAVDALLLVGPALGDLDLAVGAAGAVADHEVVAAAVAAQDLAVLAVDLVVVARWPRRCGAARRTARGGRPCWGRRARSAFDSSTNGSSRSPARCSPRAGCSSGPAGGPGVGVIGIPGGRRCRSACESGSGSARVPGSPAPAATRAACALPRCVGDVGIASGSTGWARRRSLDGRARTVPEPPDGGARGDARVGRRGGRAGTVVAGHAGSLGGHVLDRRRAAAGRATGGRTRIDRPIPVDGYASSRTGAATATRPATARTIVAATRRARPVATAIMDSPCQVVTRPTTPVGSRRQPKRKRDAEHIVE